MSETLLTAFSFIEFSNCSLVTPAPVKLSSYILPSENRQCTGHIEIKRQKHIHILACNRTLFQASERRSSSPLVSIHAQENIRNRRRILKAQHLHKISNSYFILIELLKIYSSVIYQKRRLTVYDQLKLLTFT